MIKTVILCLTDSCNLNCKKCYVNRVVNDFDIVKVLRGLKILFRENNIRKVIFHGGEPLMIGKKNFVDVASYVRKLSPSVSLSVQTNVTLIDREWIDIFKKFNFSVGVSYRGYRDLFEELSGGGSYDDFLNGIRLLREHGLLSGSIFYFPSEYRDVVCDNLERIVDDIVELGLRNVDIHESVERGKIENFSDIVIGAQEYIFKKGYSLRIRELDMIYRLVSGRPGSKVCSWAHNCYNFIALSGNGDFYRCNRRPMNYRVLYDECLTCPIFGLCEGGCETVREMNDGKNPYCDDRIRMYKYVVENLNKFYLHYDFL